MNPKQVAKMDPQMGGGLEEFLGHIGAATLVYDVRSGEEKLENDDEGDEEAHSWGRGGDHYSLLATHGQTKPTGGHTTKNSAMQTLRQAQMRRLQCLLQLIELIFVVLTLQITLDSLEDLFHAQKAGVEGSDLVPCSEFLEQVCVAILVLGVLVG